MYIFTSVCLCVRYLLLNVALVGVECGAAGEGEVSGVAEGGQQEQPAAGRVLSRQLTHQLPQQGAQTLCRRDTHTHTHYSQMLHQLT